MSIIMSRVRRVNLAADSKKTIKEKQPALFLSEMIAKQCYLLKFDGNVG